MQDMLNKKINQKSTQPDQVFRLCSTQASPAQRWKIMFNKEKKNPIKLKVGELLDRSDFGRGIVRISTNHMKQLGIAEGDALEIEGKKKTVAVTMRAYPADAGIDVIRMDGLSRKNVGVSISETVNIKPVEVKEAKSITLAPRIEEGGNISIMWSNNMQQHLLMRVIAKNDIIELNSVFRQNRDPFQNMNIRVAGSGMFGQEVEDMIQNMMGGLGAGLRPRNKFVVIKTEPAGYVRITENTRVILSKQPVKDTDLQTQIPEVLYEDLGGLHNEIKVVREMIELPIRHPELFQKLNIDPPKGILLQGPPGTGKTLLAKAVANESGANFIVINGPEIVSKFYGESEANLRKIFEQAEKDAPSIIFIDEIDAIAPKREETHGEVERRVVSQLLTLMDGLAARGKVIVIGATNRPNSLDPALRRPGRFDREIEIGVPDKKGRKEILQIHTRGMPLDKNIKLSRIADITHGYVGADLAALTKEAAMHSLRRILPDLNALKNKKDIPEEIIQKLIINSKDFDYAMKMVEPSAMREVLVEAPKVKWVDVGGLTKVKKLLKETIEWPLKNPEAFARLGIKPPKGILLYGPPGCGKTQLAKAIANESEANFILINAGELLSKWVGESEKRVRETFKRAKQVAPCIIFFDEIDAIASRRGRHSGDSGVSEKVVSQILTEMSGLEDMKDVVVIAATNRPDLIDTALLRPGRLDRQILITTPNEKGRLEIFKIHTKNMPLAQDINLEDLASRTKGYSGADIEALCREAGLSAMRKNMNADTVTHEDFDKALTEIKPSVSEELNDLFQKSMETQKEGKIEESMLYTG